MADSEPEPEPEPEPKMRSEREIRLFSARVSHATGRSATISFDSPAMLDAIEPDIQRCREAREAAFAAVPRSFAAALRSEGFLSGIAVERDLRYDTSRYTRPRLAVQ
jgi:hypothetical protein